MLNNLPLKYPELCPQSIKDFYQSLMKQDFAFEPISKNSLKHLCGCYVVNPDLLQQRPNQHILVPLKSSDYHVEITNSIANITLTQTYSNPTDHFLEVEYSFPISPDACVYRFVAEFAKTRIQGVVKEKEQAKQEYQQAINEGKKAAYGELNADSKDILNLKVGNVPPKETVRIEIVYLQELTLACNTFYQLHMVGTISPRYMNYIPAEQIKAGLRNEGAKMKGDFYWNFTISLRTSRKVIFFDSNSHDIELISQNDSCTQSELMMAKSCIPNKDFCFTYTTEQYQLPSYVFGRTDAGCTAMLSFIPKFCQLNIDDAYKASVMGKGFETDISHSKGEYIFLLDRSGSMGGNRIEKAKQALIFFIKSLPQDTYFNVVSFGSGSEKVFQDSVKYGDKQITSAVNKVKGMTANMGGTEIYAPLFHLITQKPIPGYPKQIFLLTDGGVSNTQGVIQMVANNNKYSRVHTIGIGNGASEDLILGCAKKGKGYHVFITDNENPADKIIQLLTDSLSPVISSMKLTYDKSIVESIIPNPESLPYVLKGELVNFYITFKGQLTNSAQFSFSYEDSLNKLPFKSQIVIDPSTTNEPFVDRMGHFKRIRLLEESQSANSNLQDNMFYVKVIDKKAEIVKQSVKHQILSVHTAFLCVEKELIDGKYEEVKGKGQVKVKVQNPYPSQYSQREQFCRLRPQMPQMHHYVPTVFDSSPLRQASCKLDSSHQKSQAKGCGGAPGASMRKRAAMPQMRPQMCVMQAEKAACMKQREFEINDKLKDMVDAEEEDQQERKPEFNFEEQLKKLDIQQTSPFNVQDLVAHQSADGSWKDIAYIEKILGNEVAKIIEKEANLIAVITYLISKWIEKHHPSTQYSLLVKKGLNFVKNHTDHFQKFQELYGKYIK